MSETKKCPYCGSEEGYSMYERVHRHLNFDFNDNPIGASEDVTEYAGTRRYCLYCKKILPKKMFEED